MFQKKEGESLRFRFQELIEEGSFFPGDGFPERQVPVFGFHNWFQEAEDSFYAWQEEEVLLLDWEGCDQREHYWSIREICMICGNSMFNCTCDLPKLEKLPSESILRPFTPKRMDYPRHIQFKPLRYIPEAKFFRASQKL